MADSTRKNNLLTGYLLLFIVLLGLDLLVIVVDLFRNFEPYYWMIALESSNIYAVMYIGTLVIDIILTSLVVIFFLNRKKFFIKLYIVSSIYKILIVIIGTVIFSPIFMVENDIFDITKSVLRIVLSIAVFLFFLNYFKTSLVAKVYLKSSPDKNRRSREIDHAKRKLKIKLIK